MSSRLDRRPVLWLALGVALVIAAHLRGGVGALGWLAPVPFLRYARVTRGVGSRFALLGAIALAWTLAMLKIAEPMPLFALPIWGVVLAVFQGTPILLHAALGRRLPTALAPLVYPAALAVGEWAQHALTPFGSWGSLAYTQTEDQPLLQLASLTGLAGITFLVAWIAALGEALLATPRALRRHAVVAVTALLAVHVGGSVRLAITSGEARPTGLVAAIDTPATTAGLPLPTPAETAAWDATLFARTRVAAAAGAELVVWPEAGTLVLPADEARWQAAVTALAREVGSDVVAGYVMPVSLQPLLYENKYIFARADGTLDHSYLKNDPVPGEPAIPGAGPSPHIAARFGEVAGAICYDYDFPHNGRARAGVDLVALPSSDWRAIDPIHTHMAAVRAIESGHSILRATRWGLSAGIDPEGRMRGTMSHFDDPRGILLVALPRHGVTTLYALLGEWFVALLGAGLVAAAALAWRRRAARATLAGDDGYGLVGGHTRGAGGL